MAENKIHVVENKVHVLRVQMGTKRQWWVQGDKQPLDVVKTNRSLAFAIQLYEDTNCRTVDRIVQYKGIALPAEAAMTLTDVVIK